MKLPGVGRTLVAAALLACAVAAPGPAVAGPQGPDQAPDPELQRARALLQEGDLAEARAVLDGIVERRPDDSEAHMLLGRVALGMGDAEAARSHLDRAGETSPRFPFMLHYSRAMLEMALHDFGAGRDELDGCLALAPRFGLARVARARARLFLGDVAGARDDLDAALSGPDPPPAARLLLGEVDLLQGRGDRAVARFRELADTPTAVGQAATMYLATLGGRPDETAPRVRAWVGANLNDAHAYFWLGLVEGARGEGDTAASLLRTALAIDDQHAPSLIALRGLEGATEAGTDEAPLPPPYPGLAWEMGAARAALADGRPDEAAATARDILAVRPRFVPARLLLVQVAEAGGDPVAAMGQLVEIRRLLPDLPQVLVRHATLARQVRAWDVAEEATRRALELTEATSQESERGALHYLLGTVLAGRGETDAAVDALRRAIDEGYDEAAVWVELGNLLYERQDIAGAVEALRQAVDRDPAAAEHVASFALTAMTAEDTRRVRDILEAYRADHPDDPNTLYALGSLYLREGELERAEEALERLRALQPERSQVIYNLATVYRRQGRAEDAETAMDEFRRLKAEEERLWEEHNRAFQRRQEATAALEAGDTERAIRILTELVQGVGAEPGDLSSLGRAHLRAGDAAAARRWFGRALQAAPYDPETLCAASAAAARLGDPAEAERLARRASLLGEPCPRP